MDAGLVEATNRQKQLPFKAAAGLILLFAVLMVMNFVLNGYYLRIVNLVGINIILVVSLNLTNGFTGIFSLGHAAFMAIGGYTVALLTMPVERKAVYLPDLPSFLAHVYLPFLPSLIIAGLLAVICAYLIGYPVLKLRGHYLAVATLGFMVIINVLIMNFRDITRGNSGLTGLQPYTNIWWTYAVAVITLYVIWRVLNSTYGRAMTAIREDDLAAEAVGVNLVSIKLMSFAIGAFFAAIGGALYGHLLTMVSPNDFSYSMMFGLVVMLVVGGIGSIPGAVFGAVIVTLLPELFLNKLERGIDLLGIHLPQMFGVSQVLMSVAIILIVIFKPKGLLGK
ncbi:branched-chain amino acid transport system permease protein [Desulfotomaculum arcticum]|uniref:Branched-chain amino acid transport system permease protein n=1 Tax=Desulfotruncus arcticus DSM 17038 TaxID=1121424 RepID=A0A1I2V5P5_9FIRM|nr:branched-chain amino acid ABC transporter permease [Desulfotruncus arcticus]SFG84715.1 branched-chain amino acid transport system permease protein [Desulfotomaculum arcticum] [Desulfotruncus arcticus DSM 17038]